MATPHWEDFTDEAQSLLVSGISGVSGVEVMLARIERFRREFNAAQNQDERERIRADFDVEAVASRLALAMECDRMAVRERFTSGLVELMELVAVLKRSPGSLQPSTVFMVTAFGKQLRRWAEDSDTILASKHEFTSRNEMLNAVLRYCEPPTTRHIGHSRWEIRFAGRRAMLSFVVQEASNLRSPSILATLHVEHREQASRIADQILSRLDALASLESSRMNRKITVLAAGAVSKAIETCQTEDDYEYLQDQVFQIRVGGNTRALREEDVLSDDTIEARAIQWYLEDEEFFAQLQDAMDEIAYAAAKAFNLGALVERRNKVEHLLDSLSTLLIESGDVGQSLGDAARLELFDVIEAARLWLCENPAVTLDGLITLETELRACAAEAGLPSIGSILDIAHSSSGPSEEQAPAASPPRPTDDDSVLDAACTLVQDLHGLRMLACDSAAQRDLASTVVKDFEAWVEAAVFAPATNGGSPVPIDVLIKQFEACLRKAERQQLKVPASCWARIQIRPAEGL